MRLLMNGPESFTPDNYFILGEAPEVRRYYVGAGFCSGGIAAAGGAGQALAQWIVETGRRWISRARTSAASALPRRSNSSRAGERGRGHPLLHRLSQPRARPPAAGCGARRSTIASPPRAPASGPRWAGSAPTGSPPPASRRRPSILRPPELVPLRRGRASRRPRGGGPVRQTSFGKLLLAGARRGGGAPAPLRQRRGGAAGAHRLHGPAQRAGRLRERPHGVAAVRTTAIRSSPARPRSARRALDTEPHRARERPPSPT